MINRVLLLCKVDREDYWWVSGITLPIHADSGDSYLEMIEVHRPYLESTEVIEWLLEEFCLQDDVFNEEYDDHDFTFQHLDINHRATWVFVNGEGEEYEFTLDCNTIHHTTGIAAPAASKSGP